MFIFILFFMILIFMKSSFFYDSLKNFKEEKRTAIALAIFTNIWLSLLLTMNIGYFLNSYLYNFMNESTIGEIIKLYPERFSYPTPFSSINMFFFKESIFSFILTCYLFFQTDYLLFKKYKNIDEMTLYKKTNHYLLKKITPIYFILFLIIVLINFIFCYFKYFF